jgi:aromatic-L-amino-acid decarboxylase
MAEGKGDPPELELSAEAMRAMVDQAMARIVRHLDSLPQQPITDVAGGDVLARSTREPLPMDRVEFSALLDHLFGKLIPMSYNTASPGYLAYIPGGGIFHSAVADLISDATNRYVGVWAAAPGLVQIEADVVSWFAEIVGYPSEARGILTSGGSLANFTAIVTARRNRLPEDFLSGCIYASDQVHHSVVKAAIMAGFPEKNVREIPCDETFRIRTDALLDRIAADRQSGRTPFLLVASAGTTNTGAVDNLPSLADIAVQEKLWLHVDAAYGGFLMLTERGRRAMRGIERSDSIILDPHKGLFLPYGTGSLLVRNGDALRRAHAIDAHYMPPMQQHPDRVDFCNYSSELSRDFRGLRVWLPFKLHGVEPFRRNLDEKLDLIQWTTEELRKIPGIEILAEPQLTIVAFRYRRPGLAPEQMNRLNRNLLERINRRQRVFLTSTLLHGTFAIRICILSFRTHLDRMQACVEDIRASIAEMP